jgi:hypothetical protein
MGGGRTGAGAAKKNVDMRRIRHTTGIHGIVKWSIWDIPLHRPYIGLIYGRYLQFRFLKWPLKWVLCTWKKYVKQEQLEREIALKEHLSKVRTALHHDGTIWSTACHIHIEDLEMNPRNLCIIFKNHLLNRVFHNSYIFLFSCYVPGKIRQRTDPRGAAVQHAAATRRKGQGLVF